MESVAAKRERRKTREAERHYRLMLGRVGFHYNPMENAILSAFVSLLSNLPFHFQCLQVVQTAIQAA